MAVRTLGAATLTAVVFSPTPVVLLPADMATINAAVRNDQNAIGQQAMNTSLSFNGTLYVPNRGQLKILPGDVIAVDPATGFPILVSAQAIAGTNWTLV